ncbi:MAG: DNA primase [Acidobacteria bacterium]|nr:DNA primase [Acidobacteriota bacterium]
MSGEAVGLIKNQLPLSQLVARYAQLERRGNRMAACCPFHNEKTPSFYVDDNKGFFHCFGCGKGGDLIAFAMEMEQLPFQEALVFLAELAGVELPETRTKGPSRDQQTSLFAINQAAAQYYQKQLRTHSIARDYIQNRGIDKNSMELFGLGWAPEAWESLVTQLKSEYPESVLASCGLFKQGRNGFYDLFRERVIFPIADAQGRLVAFGGRRIDQEQPKYINSPESPIYTKGRHVYNLNLAKAYLKKEPNLIIVEGYMDALQLFQAGFGNVVASLGTAFTPEQARLIKRYAQTIFINFDGDAAGFKAARASIETLLAVGAQLKVITLPDNLDPDDFIRQQGPAAYREQLNQAPDFFEFLTTYYAEKGSMSDPAHQSMVVNEMGAILVKASDEIVREHYLNRMAEFVGLSLSLVKKVLKEESKSQPASPKRQTSAPVTRPWANKLEQEFLFLIMHQPNWAESMEPKQQMILSQLTQHLFADRPFLTELIQNEHTDFNAWLESVPETHRPSLRALFFSDEYQVDPERLTHLIPDLTRQMIRNRIEINTQAIKACPASDQARKRSLWQQNIKWNERLHQLDAAEET